MKHINIIAIFFTFALLIVGCKDTNENLVGSRGLGVVPIISDLQPAVFDSNDLENTYVEFKLDVEDKSKLENAIIKVSLNGKMQRVDYATFTTFPQMVKVSLKDAIAKLGADFSKIGLGDIINVEVWTTTNGKAYPTKAVFNASVVCAYKSANVTGSYHSVSKDWASEGDITITVDPNDEFTVYISGLEVMEGLVEDKGPLKMVIDRNSYSIKVDRQVIVSDVSSWGVYTNLAYAGTGTLNTCDGTYKMSFDISVDQTSFATAQVFTFTKN
jgi:hypothetical protein